MALEYALDVRSIGFVGAAAFFFLVAGFLVHAGFQNRALRVFALIVTLEGVAHLLSGFAGTALRDGRFADDQVFHVLLVRTALAEVCALAYFASVYPRPRGPLASQVWQPWVWLVASLGLQVLYPLDRSLFSDMLHDANGTRVFVAGPLAPLRVLVFALFAALVLARQARRAPDKSRRDSYLLVSAGLAAAGLGAFLSIYVPMIQFYIFRIGQRPPVSLAAIVDRSITVLLCLTFVVLLIWTVLSILSDSPGKIGTAVRNYFWFLTAVTLIAIARHNLLYILRGMDTSALATTLDASIAAALPLVAAYGLTKYRVFDLDRRLGFALTWILIGLLLLIVFVVATQLAQLVLTTGPTRFVIGVVAAALVLFAHSWLRRFLDRFAGKIFPNGKPVDELTPQQRIALFLDHAKIAWEDGTLDSRERQRLTRLGQRLGLHPDEIARLERQAESKTRAKPQP